MTKAELIDRVAERASISRTEAEAVVNTVLTSIVRALQEGDKVELRGFGSFRLRLRRARIGRNPKTGERVAVPAKSVPYFKPGKELRELLNPQDHDGGSASTDEGGPQTEASPDGAGGPGC